jgi:acyl-CoA thioesterase FadM
VIEQRYFTTRVADPFMAYTYEWTVRTGDTDFSGFVYTPTVVDYVVRGMEQLMSDIGFSPSSSNERGFVYPAVHAEADYLGTFGVDDEVTIELVPAVGETSITLDAVGTLDEETVFTADLTLACVDEETMEPVRVPNDVRERLTQYAE